MTSKNPDPTPLIDEAVGLRNPRLVDGWIVGVAPCDTAASRPVLDPTRTTSSTLLSPMPIAPVASEAGRLCLNHSSRLGAAMVRQIGGYTPRDIAPEDFAAIEWFVKEVIAESANLSHKDPLAHAHSVASFVHWAHNLHGRPLERKAIFVVPLILNFTERALAGRSDGYISTYRSRLMGVARIVNPAGVVPLPTRQRRAVNNPPYEAGEVNRFLSTAAGLGRPYRRRSATLMIALSAGAGLNPIDYIRLRNRHVQVDAEGADSGVVVTVPEGAGTSRTSLRPRRVLVLREYEGVVRDLMSSPDLDTDGFLVWEQVVETRENLQALTSGMKRAFGSDNERPILSRLRTTWIVRHLNLGTPISVLLEASGLNSAESLHRYMDFVPAPDWETSRQYLRGDQNLGNQNLGDQNLGGPR